MICHSLACLLWLHHVAARRQARRARAAGRAAVARGRAGRAGTRSSRRRRSSARQRAARLLRQRPVLPGGRRDALPGPRPTCCPARATSTRTPATGRGRRSRPGRATAPCRSRRDSEHQLPDRARVAVREPRVRAVEELERVRDAELVELGARRPARRGRGSTRRCGRRRGRCGASSAARRRGRAPSAPGPSASHCAQTSSIRRPLTSNGSSARPGLQRVGRVARRRSRRPRAARSTRTCGGSALAGALEERVPRAVELVAQQPRDLRELGQVTGLEQRVAGVRGERAEDVGAQHRHDHRAVAAAGLAGQAAVVAARRPSGSARRRTRRPRRTGSPGSGRCRSS